MLEVKPYIETLFKSKGISLNPRNQILFDDFVSSDFNKEVVKQILENQNQIMENWKLKTRISDIINQPIIIPNGTIGKPYSAKIDFQTLNLTDLISEDFKGLDEIGLAFNPATDTIEGIPKISGDLKFQLLFKVTGQNENGPNNVKSISLIVNPDPKTLWKDIPSDKTDPFWKEDDVSVFGSLGKKSIVVSSKRGRSHKNVGSFRDDDFGFKYFEKTGWAVVAVSDGAGSYSLSRKGSQIACRSVIDFFENHQDFEKQIELEEKLKAYQTLKDENIWQEIEILAKQNLYKATVFVHNKIKEEADQTYKSHPEIFINPKAKTSLDYYHSTLIFALFKKFDNGYLILTFGVGDCPIGILNTNNEATLLNWLDVGEFGGGTRFITQPEIFHSIENPMATRFNVKLVPDFSYLFLMTDGIYDPKFVVEANLEKSEKWKEFLEDLKGSNEDNLKVDFASDNKEISNQLSAWMDFWNPGNHDDRTLAVIF